MDTKQTIFDFVVSEITAYRLPISVFDDYEWGMYDHIRKTIFYKHSLFTKGKANDENRPFKNIIYPILNLQYRAEDIDVKDVVLFIDDPDYSYLSFLVKKYHDEIFIKENNLDTLFDDAKEEKIDFGGVLVKNTSDVKVKVVDWQSIAFCDQKDILSAPFGIQHFYNPAELLEMAEKGWGEISNGATMNLEEAVLTAKNYKREIQTGRQSKTTGNYIEVYEIHGVLPNFYLDEKEEDNKYSLQMQIIILDKSKQKADGNSGIILFRKKEKESPFKFHKRTRFYNRALGMGGAEELFGPQIWTNYSEIRKKEMLDAASKVILKTTDKGIVARHPTGAKDMDNLEFLVVDEGKDVGQLDTYPRSIVLFEKMIQEQETQARLIGSAQEAILGEQPPAGTPFKSVEFQALQSHSLHQYRRGKYAKFVEEIYRDWIIPYIAKKITQGKKFLSELSFEEMESISEIISENQANKQRNEQVLNGEIPTDKEILKQQLKEGFMKGGNKKIIEILKDELKDVPIKISINVAGKQKNLAAIVDKIVNIFRFIFQNPQGFAQIMQMPGMSKAWNEILEYSGLSPINFTGIEKITQPVQPIQSPMGQGQLTVMPAMATK